MAQSLGQHRYDISFVPRELADHTISVRFNNEPVPGKNAGRMLRIIRYNPFGVQAEEISVMQKKMKVT